MINNLLNAMSSYMSIAKYTNENEESFACRLCYSALGLWCLNIAQNKEGKIFGATKNKQTIVLNELLARYTTLFPCISKYFYNDNPQIIFSRFIRRVYEETGYLITEEDNRNRVANWGRSIRIGEEAMFFGIPKDINTVNGLGLFAMPTNYEVSIRDFLIRDNLTCDEYINEKFDPIYFHKRDLSMEELTFFDALSDNPPSRSWQSYFNTEYSIARESETGPFYCVIKTPDGLIFNEERIEAQTDKFNSYEYRRLYFAIKNYYKKPQVVRIIKIDENYSYIQLSGHLPNREYYLLLLLSWPVNGAFDKTKFIIKNNLLKGINSAFKSIGLKIQEEKV